MRVELHPEAQAELRTAAVWYDEQRPGLGDELVDEVTTLLAKRRRDPGILSGLARDFRRAIEHPPSARQSLGCSSSTDAAERRI